MSSVRVTVRPGELLSPTPSRQPLGTYAGRQAVEGLTLERIFDRTPDFLLTLPHFTRAAGGAICAERTAIVKGVSEGKRRFVALAVTS